MKKLTCLPEPRNIPYYLLKKLLGLLRTYKNGDFSNEGAQGMKVLVNESVHPYSSLISLCTDFLQITIFGFPSQIIPQLLCSWVVYQLSSDVLLRLMAQLLFLCVSTLMV